MAAGTFTIIMIQFKRLDHVLITIPPGTKAAAQAFYGGTLGLEEIPGQHPRGATWYRIGDIELHLTEEEGTYQSDRHPAFEVTDLAAARAFLESHGIAISTSSTIVGRERCFFRDPFGNRFELIEYLTS